MGTFSYIDTHCHLSDEAFAGQEQELIDKAQRAGVGIMLQPDVDSSERDAMFAVCRRHPDTLKPMLGLYPGSVDENWESELQAVYDHDTEGVVALGEIGLDYHYGAQHAEEQKKVLRLQLELAAKLDLPVNIHLREATEDFFRILSDCRHLALRGNIHAFSGSYETFQRLVNLGDWYVGIGGVATFRRSNLAVTLEKIPLGRILLETDSPYMAPEPLRGTRNDSSNIPIIAEKIATIKGLDIQEVASVTTANALSLFRLNIQ